MKEHVQELLEALKQEKEFVVKQSQEDEEMHLYHMGRLLVLDSVIDVLSFAVKEEN